ncbi:orotidine-5'-phosphate decarboxylase [Frondihabitans sp. PhB188]|uniref:orotidine-5'-phosphate decarboxylase n=1 Tax=Frondihabitans sp. PhB188 TaxID=2485200 RepID=UPI000F488DF4|nr:orotidine-5'-phosphate decarboxylase [Frondihabitans sp. PhB188]ROQ41032.1 orotidine-5'-phosphate decarboxylase [Frondihabitans sp. PhB188]
MAFGTRLAASFEAFGHVCVGIDPHPFLLEEWGLPISAAGARDFGLRVVEASAGTAPAVKPQVAFYERYGSAGFAALEDVLEAARSTDLLVVGDAKRGDIGTTMDSYGDAWFAADSPLRVDALTVAAYQGLGADSGLIARARAAGAGVFVLAATSNPEARLTQTASLESGKTVAAGIVDDVLHDNTASDQGVSFGSVGLVLGATVALTDYGIDTADLATTPILAPGFGAQGARYADVRSLFGPAAGSVLVSASRSILGAGSDGVAAAVRAASDEVTACLA